MNRFVMRGAVAAMAAAFLLLPGAASAHCDSFDGPVIKEAQKALQTNQVKLLYKWITPADEAEITALFDKTSALRGGDAEIYAIVENPRASAPRLGGCPQYRAESGRERETHR